MRIGVDARELQGRPTGVGRYLRNLLRAWPSGGDRLHLYFDGPAPEPPPTSPAELVFRTLEPARHGLLWLERRLPPAALRDGIDVFFASAYTCSLRLRCPRVTTVHDMSFYSLPEDFTTADALRRRLTVGASIRASRVVLVPSEFTRSEVATRFPETAPRLRVVPEAAAADLPSGPSREEARRRLGLGGPYVLSVGAILNRRRLPTLLRGARLLLPRWPGLVVDVVGENRTHPPLDLADMARRLGLSPALRLSGFVPDHDLALRYAAADAFVYLSEYEGFGLPVLEALARGLPVVTADRRCLADLYRSAAALVDPGDERALAQALDRLLSDPAAGDEGRRRGHALVDRFSWTESARLTRQALVEALP